MKTSASMILAAGSLAAVAAPASAAPTVLVPTLSAPTSVAAYAGTVMWSEQDAVTGTFKLMKSVDGGAPVAVPVAPRAGAFDIDLGTNRSGSLYAVYTRDGDLYRTRVSNGQETKLTKLSDPNAAERDPSIQRGEIAFIRRVHGRDQIRIGDTTTGARGTRFVRSAAVVESVELGISQMAYAVGVPSADFGQTNVHVRNIRTGHDMTVYVAKSGGANAAAVTRPSFMDDFSGFVWARTNNGSGAGNRIVKYTLRGSRLSYAQGTPRYATGAWAGRELGFAASTALVPSDNDGCDDAGKNYCAVLFTGPLTFGS